MVVVPETSGSGCIWPVASSSRCLKRECPQTFCNSLAKIDAEGSEFLPLAQPREWQRARVLIFEFSAARCRKHTVGPLPLVSVLEALRLSIQSPTITKRKGTSLFWGMKSSCFCSNGIYPNFCMRRENSGLFVSQCRAGSRLLTGA